MMFFDSVWAGLPSLLEDIAREVGHAVRRGLRCRNQRINLWCPSKEFLLAKMKQRIDARHCE